MDRTVGMADIAVARGGLSIVVPTAGPWSNDAGRTVLSVVGLWQNRQGNSTEHNRHVALFRHVASVRLCVFRRILARDLTNGKQQSRRSCFGCESQRFPLSKPEKPNSQSRQFVSVTSVMVDERDAPLFVGCDSIPTIRVGTESQPTNAPR